MSVISYKCPNCDGELIFDPKTQKYKCEYCFSLFDQAQLDAMKPDTQEEQTDSTKDSYEAESAKEDAFEQFDEQNGEDGMIYTCPSCGAQIVTDATTAATFCYYCHNPVVLGGRLSGENMPDKIIPFAIDKKEAEKKFLDYVNSKKFIPRAFFNKKQIELFSGVYFPYWIYNTSIKGRMTAEAKKVRVYRHGDTEFTETSFYEVEREGNIQLQDMTENALKKANHVLADGVMPYRMEDAKAFNFGFLSGFLAEKKDIEKDEVSAALQAEAKDYADKMLRESIDGYSSVHSRNSSFSANKEEYAYTLLPVWTITYPGKNGKTYYYSMNGQTGKICGELPVDYKKVALTALISGVAALLIGLLGGYFIW
ncbi:MAG: TFIIB-type zinc ribbon-containing protein [Lachnospiraceae bacterium]|nr:TFIIB-type zinc ribbon-containing protein [Lachnospiraceae bacterium]